MGQKVPEAAESGHAASAHYEWRAASKLRCARVWRCRTGAALDALRAPARPSAAAGRDAGSIERARGAGTHCEM